MNKHPYRFRKWLRERLPWFLIRAGFGAKGKDCEAVAAPHKWYNMDDENSGCYYCKVIKEGQLWKKD